MLKLATKIVLILTTTQAITLEAEVEGLFWTKMPQLDIQPVTIEKGDDYYMDLTPENYDVWDSWIFKSAEYKDVQTKLEQFKKDNKGRYPILQVGLFQSDL